MSSYDDDIEFDFFDEPETEEATQRRRLPRLERQGPPRGEGPRRPVRPPHGLMPLLRLLGLIASAIVVVVLLVFWVQSCQGKSKHDRYASYMANVRTIAKTSDSIGNELRNKLASNPKQAELVANLTSWAGQEQQLVTQATEIRPPGPLRDVHTHLIDALTLRARGLKALGDAFSQTASDKDAAAAATQLSAQAQLLTASDVVWRVLYQQSALDTLKAQDVTGVVPPDSVFVPNPDLFSTRSLETIFSQLHQTVKRGTPSGLHGSALVGVKALPDGVQLSTSQPTTVKVTPDLQFAVTFKNSGNFTEVGVVVTLRIETGAKPIILRKTVDSIASGQEATVTFGNLNLPSSVFGARTTVRAEIGAVPGEVKTDNNSATYTVFFSLG